MINGFLDFAPTFSDGEYSHKYKSGRRLWRALSIFAPKFMSNYQSEYDNIY